MEGVYDNPTVPQPQISNYVNILRLDFRFFPGRWLPTTPDVYTALTGAGIPAASITSFMRETKARSYLVEFCSENAAAAASNTFIAFGEFSLRLQYLSRVYHTYKVENFFSQIPLKNIDLAINCDQARVVSHTREYDKRLPGNVASGRVTFRISCERNWIPPQFIHIKTINGETNRFELLKAGKIWRPPAQPSLAAQQPPQTFAPPSLPVPTNSFTPGVSTSSSSDVVPITTSPVAVVTFPSPIPNTPPPCSSRVSEEPFTMQPGPIADGPSGFGRWNVIDVMNNILDSVCEDISSKAISNASQTLADSTHIKSACPPQVDYGDSSFSPVKTRLRSSRKQSLVAAPVRNAMIFGDSHAQHWMKSETYRSNFSGTPNFAQSGAKSSDLVGQIPRDGIPPFKTTIVVSIGTNDITSRIPYCDFFSNLTKFISKFNSSHELFILEPPPFRYGSSFIRNHGQIKYEFIGKLRAWAKYSRVHLFPYPRSLLGQDGQHFFHDDQHLNTSAIDTIVIPHLSSLITSVMGGR